MSLGPIAIAPPTNPRQYVPPPGSHLAANSFTCQEIRQVSGGIEFEKKKRWWKKKNELNNSSFFLAFFFVLLHMRTQEAMNNYATIYPY